MNYSYEWELEWILEILLNLKSSSKNIYCKLQCHFHKTQNQPQVNNILFRDPYIRDKVYTREWETK